MKPTIQLPQDPLQKQLARQQAEAVYINQFVRETARDLFTESTVLSVHAEEDEIRQFAQRCIKTARIFAEEALGIRFNNGEQA